MGTFNVRVFCRQSNCFNVEAETVGFARIFAMRHYEERGHADFTITREAYEAISFPQAFGKYPRLQGLSGPNNKAAYTAGAAPRPEVHDPPPSV